MQKSLINRRVLSTMAAILLFVPGVEFAQKMSAPPIPIWSGQGSVPAGSGDRRVFLSPDLHSVIILWPNPDGTLTRRRFNLHNTIFPDLRVHMEGTSDSFRYTYELENGKQSRDSLRDFSVVIYPDQNAQLASAEWTIGAIFSNVPHERVGIPGAPSGVMADWTCRLNDQLFLQPGSKTSFTINSEAKPGFTSAATEYFPHLDLSDEWPEEILDQLEPVLDLKWIRYHFITFGPRYGPDVPATGIAADYLVGIQELIRIHRLEASSPFVKEVIANLDAIASGSSAQIPITQEPISAMEAEILNALQLSLHFTYKEPQ
jgi:hypothetical protein